MFVCLLCIRKTYKKYGLKAIFQGGEKNEVADVFFHGYANYEKGLGKQFLKLTSIKESLPSLKELTEKEAKTIILIHQGSDIEYHNYASTSPHAKIISQLLGKPVEYIDDVCGPAARDKIKALKNSQILMLENVRFMAEEMTLFETKLDLTPEEQAKTLVVRKLAPLSNLYVCDAFAAGHRSQPTLVGMEEVLPSAMGRLLEKEITPLI